MVAAGVATGLEIFGLLSPVAGDHEYAEPPEALSVVFVPVQMVELIPGGTTGVEVTVTTNVAVFGPQGVVTVNT